jgi:glycosyltransferase involved in cell wall biosynthesis
MIRREPLSGFDVAHVEHLRGARYAAALGRELPVVWDSVDCISYLFRQAASHSRTFFGRCMTRFELPRTEALERAMPARVSRVLLTSPVDRQAYATLLTEPALAARLSVLPNGVDTDYYQPGSEPPEQARLVFTGKLSYHANATAALYLIEKIMPRIWMTHPDTRLSIAGQSPGPALRSAAGRDARVELHANVLDLRPHLARAQVAIAPMVYGAGIQMKVLEAMAMGRPVVATSRATSALQAVAGAEYLRADSTAEIAQAVRSLLDDASLRARVGQAGLAYVKRKHCWNRLGEELERIYLAARSA